MKTKIRELKSSDMGFITSTWLKHYYEWSTWKQTTRSKVFFNEHHKLIHSILLNSRVLLACSQEDENFIFAYLCGSNEPWGDLLHYCYAKRSLRDFGLENEMVQAFKKSDKLIHTHAFTKGFMKENNFSSYGETVYNPYLFLNGDYHENFKR